MNHFWMLILSAGVCTATAARLSAHGVPVDLFVNSITNRLYVVENFEHGVLELVAGIEISTDAPGIGVSFASNGVAAGASLEVDVTQPLLYWNGTSLADPTVSLWLDNPAQTETWTISATSGEQTGLSWATYPGGNFWDADGLFTLDSLSAPAGIYGLVVRVTSPNYGSSKPFLIRLAFSEQPGWDLDAGHAALQAAVITAGTGDFDADDDVDGADFLSWQRGLTAQKRTTTLADGDADGDSDVDDEDLSLWSNQYGAGLGSARSAVQTVPEPSTLCQCLFASWLISQTLRFSRV